MARGQGRAGKDADATSSVSHAEKASKTCNNRHKIAIRDCSWKVLTITAYK
jgi:hypothetical protein